MQKRTLFIITTTFSLFWLSGVFAETHITGNINDMNFDESSSPYIVEQDIIVPSGKKVTIGPGCVFLFKSFTGFHVQGELVVKGTEAKPVVFTSIHDQTYNPNSKQLPNPFDWNGILVTRESGRVSLMNFKLTYSVYGVKSQIPDIKITNGVFSANGQFHFTINDKIQFVQDNIPFSYNDSGDKPKEPKSSVQMELPVRPIIRYTSLGLGVAGVGTGVFFAIRSSMAKNERESYDSDSRQLKGNADANDDPEKAWDDAEKRRRNSAIASGISFGLGGAFLVGFGLTFVF